MSYSANEDGFERVDGFDDNPPPYSVTPADESRKQQEKVGLKMEYVKSKPGIIKIIMIVSTVNSPCNDIGCNDIPHVTIQIRGPCRSLI